MSKKKIIITILIGLMSIFILIIILSCSVHYVSIIFAVRKAINNYPVNPLVINYKENYIIYDNRKAIIRPQNSNIRAKILHVTDDYIIYYENSINHYDVYKLSNQGSEKLFDFDATVAFSSIYYNKNYIVYGYDLSDSQKYSFNLVTNEKKEISDYEYSDILNNKYMLNSYSIYLEIYKGNVCKTLDWNSFKKDKLFAEISDTYGREPDYRVEAKSYDNKIIYIIMSIGEKYIIYNYDFVLEEINYVTWLNECSLDSQIFEMSGDKDSFLKNYLEKNAKAV